MTACSGDRSGAPTSSQNPRSASTASAGQQPAPRAATRRTRTGFVLPSRAQRNRAIGLSDMALESHAQFAPGDDFSPIRAPKTGEWLAEHREPGQTFAEYVRSAANRPTSKRRTIYIVPVGSFSERAPKLDLVARFSRIYFGLPTEVLPAVTVASVGATERVNAHSGQRQLLSTDVLSYLERNNRSDAYATIALTEIDLYPEESWNFVFGQASLSNRVGVFSLARYQPGGEDSPANRRTALRRSLKVMAHETLHMFGIQHCVYFECVVNGSNHLQETDSRPVHACPVDLRKLHHAVGFDVLARYRALARFYRANGLAPEAKWVQARVATLTR